MLDTLQKIGILIAVLLFCFWGALCVLSIGGWLFSSKQRLPQRSELTEQQQEVPGLTWRDPTMWIVAFFLWPVLVALALDNWWKRRLG